MKTKLRHWVLPLAVLFMNYVNGQSVVNLGSGSYADSPPTAVWDEGVYFGKTYRELSDGWPWHIHTNKQSQPIPTNDWWTATIFEQYTGNLEAYPHRVEGTSNGIKVSLPTSYAMFDARGLSVTMGTSVTIKGSVSVAQSSDTQIFADFESSTYPSGWTVTGNPPYSGPVSLADFVQSPVPQGFLGDRFINTYAGDVPQATFTSPTFTVTKDFIHFLFGGGSDLNLNYVGLYINGIRVLAETGENSGTLKWKKFNVTAYKGQTAQIKIVDASSGGWGFSMCDNIVFSNLVNVNSSFSNSFWPQDAKAYDWSDLGLVFRLEDDQTHYMDGSSYHGVPYTYIDLVGVNPIIESSSTPTVVYNGTGGVINTFPYNGNTIVLQVDGKFFGIHAPIGTQFDKSPAGNFIPNIPANAPKYLVISVIPNNSLIGIYETYARNKITKTTFGWNYNVAGGKIETTFGLETRNYETGATAQPSLLALLPHHYRNTNHPGFIGGADYQTMNGLMHTVSGNNIILTYDFSGMPPYMPKPLNLSTAKQQRLNDLITAKVAVSEDYNGNTYAKGFGEESNIMLMAKELNHPGYETIKANIKNEMINWLTYQNAEAANGSYFFANYPQFGAFIGFPVGFGSQAFNDLHFHYGYFIMGAARLMLVDEDFKNQYGDMVKRIAKSYANWKRYGVNDTDKQPFLRNFDPFVGHSWAGGTGSGVDGNNQESTSEATHSWFGLYLLGVALEDTEIMSLGATGFMLEGQSTASYWFNRNGDMPENYIFDYVGILKANNMAMATFFDGDPAWAFGIQAVPCDFFYSYYLGIDKNSAANDWQSMLEDRVTFGEMPTTDAYTNIAEMGAYLGNYHMNYIQSYDPAFVANTLDQLIDNEGGDWGTHVNSATNYYIANANVSYGKPAAGYHTSIASGGVFDDGNGNLSILLYNHSAQSKNVNIYYNGSIVQTINVGSKQYYNSRLTGTQQSPVVNAGADQTKTWPTNFVNLVGNATDADGTIASYQWSKISGGAATIVNPNIASTTINEMVVGTYVFRLTATDNTQLTGYDDITITINPPTQSCGTTNSALNMSATASTNEGNLIAANAFDGNAGTRWGSAFTDAEWLRVDLGSNKNVCQVTLSWEGAYGKDYEIRIGTITDINLSQVIATVTGGDGGTDNVITNSSIAGRYVWMKGIKRATAWGYSLWEMQVNTLNTTNHAPVANAGPDRTLGAGTTYLTLEAQGSDPDGDPTSCSWTQISGPFVTLSNANTCYLALSNLQNGNTYGFRLTLSDGQLTGSDDVLITVNSQPNQPPVVNAGADQSLPAGTTSANLTATASDPENAPVYVTWSQVSGPTATLSSAVNLATTVSGLTNGNTYVFRISATDQQLTATDEITISVAGGSTCGTTNIALGKTAAASTTEGNLSAGSAFDGNAGTRWGSAFNDNEWLRVDLGSTSNVCQVTLQWEGAYGKNYEIRIGATTDINASTIIATVTNGDGGQDIVQTNSTVSGRYLWMKGVTRGTGYGYSLWEMVVNAQGIVTNHAPIANAGNDLSLPSSTTVATITGSGTDQDGDALSYSWSKVSGPVAQIVNPNSPSTQITGLTAGSSYTFQLIVNDGNVNSPADQVVINIDQAVVSCTQNVALNKPAASSSQEGNLVSANSFDGNNGTRWASNYSDDEWLRVDLGAAYKVCQVSLKWEAAYGKNYEIRIGNTTDINASTVIATVTGGDGGDDLVTTNQNTSGRYIWMKGIVRATGWGYSIWEMKVFGSATGARLAGNPDLEIASANKISIYPNPVENTLKIILDKEDTNGHVEVLSLEGKRLMTININGLEGSFDVSQLKSGLYLLKFSGKENQLIKFVKQ